VQSCTNLTMPDWDDLLPAITATNVTASTTLPAPTGNKFYRVKLLTP